MIAERSQMTPGYDPIEVERRLLESMDIPDAAQVYPTVENPETGALQLAFPPQPDPELEIKKADMQRRTLEGKVRGEVDLMKAESQIMVDQAKVMVMIAELEADKEAEGNKVRIEELKLLVKEFEINRKAMVEMYKADEQSKQRANQGVGG